LVVSLVLIWTGVGTIYFKGGIPLGIEFTGGTAVLLQFKQPVAEDGIRKAVTQVSKDAVVQQYGDPKDHEILVRLPIMKGQEQGTALEADAKRVEDAVRGANVGAFDVIGKDAVGPSAGADYQSKALW